MPRDYRIYLEDMREAGRKACSTAIRLASKDSPSCMSPFHTEGIGHVPSGGRDLPLTAVCGRVDGQDKLERLPPFVSVDEGIPARQDRVGEVCHDAAMAFRIDGHRIRRSVRDVAWLMSAPPPSRASVPRHAAER